MFREPGLSTATNQHWLPNRKRSFCLPADRWVQPTQTLPKPCVNHRQCARVACTKLTTTTLRGLAHWQLMALKQWPELFIPTPSNEPGHASQDFDFLCAAWRHGAACHHLDVVARK